MPNHLSLLGIIHTAISVLALFAAAYSLFADGEIIPTNSRGRLYILLTVITCLTSLPIMKTGHFTGAHSVAVVILVLLIFGTYVKAMRIFGKFADYLQAIVMSASLFLSCIPAVVETLTRLPISHPIASGPNDLPIQKGLGILTLCFFAGIIYQIIKIKASKKSVIVPGGEARPN
ncbi:hypothetical protein [Mucilaginibacter sp. dw_454]|uniref:hypothetical protein n=1 Tax=Mucilaginibacter sp. dw_454 TaxID=2720079 RepID=UPI001BD3786B|nr:hypothetical protein [Mucilaginibacter sp. dw_454]